MSNNIQKLGNNFYIKIQYDKQLFTATCKSLKNAEIKLDEFKEIIEKIKLQYIIDNPTENLPKSIFYIGKQYFVIKKFEKKEYRAKTKTFEIAKQKLAEFEKIIQNIKNNKKTEIANREIVRNDDGIAIIPLKNKKGNIKGYAKVSDKDWNKCIEFPWHKSIYGYAYNGNKISLHSFILGKSEDSKHIIDHKNQDKLNNTRENLRFATFPQNNQNIAHNNNNTYRGISWNKKTEKWRARSSDTWLGSFDNDEEAARTYDIYTFLKYGKDSLTNGLVKYEDIKDIDIESLIKIAPIRDLPKYICFNKNCYEIRINYKKHKFYACLNTLEKAENKLKEFQTQIETIKVKEKEDHDNLEIVKDEHDNAIIYVRNKNKIIDSFIVDENIWHKCMQFTWWKSGDYYCAHINNTIKRIHHFVLGLEESVLVDHIDHKPANNKIENLRISDYSKNGHNRTKQKSITSSTYIGVSFHKVAQKWIAQIRKDKNYYLGLHKTEIEAAIAYNNKATELYGTYANLNVIKET